MFVNFTLVFCRTTLYNPEWYNYWSYCGNQSHHSDSDHSVHLQEEEELQGHHHPQDNRIQEQQLQVKHGR